MTAKEEVEFIEAFSLVQAQVHQTAQEKGWWAARNTLETVAAQGHCGGRAQLAIDSEILALVASELGELVEGLRHGNPPDDKIPQFTAAEAEAADIVIRLMDWCQRRGHHLAEAILAKAEANRGRSYMHGGKKF